MYINKINSINNYRNLSGLKFSFDSEINFIVGENNIGKTNIIELLNCIFKKGKFAEEDFCDIKNPIEVSFSISYSDDELGYFENNFDIEDEHQITISACQNSVDDRIEFFHAIPLKTSINPRIIKSLNLMYYSSLRSPNSEINFTDRKGTGKLLAFLVEYSLKENQIEESNLLNLNDTSKIIEDLNNQINKINTLTGDPIKIFISADINRLVNKILDIGDDNGRNLINLGDGIQYALNIFLGILELIHHIKTTKKEEDFNSSLIYNSDGKRYLPLIIALDEPEIHQHPYRQRALIKSIDNIMKNKNAGFLDLLNTLFNIDGLIGQVFISTHSPNILLNNYKQIIRLYKDNTSLIVKCGKDIQFDDKTYKHMLRSFLYVKESMFSKYIILVEGDTEYGAIPIFTKRLGFDLDEKCIGILKLDGADGVLRFKDLLNQFGIKSTAIIDRDKLQKYSDQDGIFFTNGMDFEEDVYDNFKFCDYLDYNYFMDNLASFIKILKSNDIEFDAKEFLKDPHSCEISEDVQLKIMSNIRDKELEILKASKNALKSSALAEFVTKIPDVFENVIRLVIEEVH